MPEDISGKIGLDTTDWKTGVAQLNRDVRVIESGFKAVSSGMDDWRKSAEGLTTRNSALTEIIDKQRSKVDLLEAEYANMKKTAAENGDETERTAAAFQEFEIKINKAKTELAKSETELRKNTAAMDDMGNETDDAGDSTKELTEHFDKAEKETKSWSERLKEVGSYIGSTLLSALKAVGTAAAAAMTAIGAAAIKLGKEVIQSFGELEQNLGGSEAVFGEYAAAIQKTGEEAYKNLGVSQSEYLANANKMGALFQGAGVSQEKSLELTEKAMQRAADMASVMGIETSAALEAVTGAAKGNYTMMDNLGVAMNATSIQAFALSKGLVSAEVDTAKLAKAQESAAKAALNVDSAQVRYNDAVKKHGANSSQAQIAANNLEKAQLALSSANQTVEKTMEPASASLSAWWNNVSQAEKAEIAMQMFFENTEQYAGNFARESTETVSGSLGLLTAATQSFVAGLGNADADIKNLAGNVVDAFQAVVKNITPVIQNLVTALPAAMPALMDGVQQLLPVLLEAIIAMLPALVSGISDMLNQAVSMIVEILPALLPVLLPAAMGLLQGIVDAITTNLSPIIDCAILLVQTFAEFLIENIPMLIQAALSIILGFVDGISAALPVLLPAAASMVTELLLGLAESLPEILNTGINMVQNIADGILTALPVLMEALPQIIAAIMDAIITSLPQILEQGTAILVSIIDGISQAIPTLAAALPQIVTTIITAITEALPQILEHGSEILSSITEGIIGAIPLLVEALPQVITSIITAIVEALPQIVSNGAEIIASLITGILQAIPDIISGIGQIISAIWDAIINTDWAELGKNLLDGIVNGMGNLVSSVKEKVTGFFKDIWGGVKSFFGIHSPSTAAAEDGKYIMEGFQKGTQDAQPSAMSKIKSVFSGIWDGIKSIFGFGGGNESAEAKKTGQDVTKAIADGVTSGGTSAQTSVKDLSKTLIELFQKELGVSGNSSTKTKVFGEAIARGLSDGWNAQSSAAQADGKKLIQQITETLAAALGVSGGASTVTKPYGERTTQGIAEGLQNALAQAVNAAKAVAVGTLEAIAAALGVSGGTSSLSTPYGRSVAQGVIDGMQGMLATLKSTAAAIGKEVSAGIAEGIRNGASAITSAARTASNNALSAAKKELGIQSPSKVMANEVGLPTVQGIAQGIRNNMGMLKDSMRGISENLTSGIEPVQPFSLPAMASKALTVISAVLQLRDKEFGELVVELADSGQGFATSNQQRLDLGVQIV